MKITHIGTNKTNELLGTVAVSTPKGGTINRKFLQNVENEATEERVWEQNERKKEKRRRRKKIEVCLEKVSHCQALNMNE